MEKGSPEPDWAGLLPELVALICEKASNTITRYIHLRLVCKAWRRALARPRNLPPQAPWLLLPRITEGEGSDRSDELIFYDPFQSKTHRFQSPYVSGKHICGSSHGWLVLEHDLKFSLFNPITQCTIDLPSFTVPATFFDYDVMGRCAHKAMLSGNPLEDGCVVVAWSSIFTNWELGFCRIGDTHWTGLLTGDNRQYLLDFVCHKNLVYAVNEGKKVSVYDLHGLSVRTFPSEIEYNGQNRLTFERIYLVHGDSKSGEPLVVRRTVEDSITKEVFVYKWFDDRQQWCQVQNIGKRVFFLDNKHSINLQLEEGQEERRENELYYDVRHLYYLSDSTPCFFGRYFRVGINQVDLNTGMHVPLNHSPTGVFLFDAFELPMWVTPSLI